MFTFDLSAIRLDEEDVMELFRSSDERMETRQSPRFKTAATSPAKKQVQENIKDRKETTLKPLRQKGHT